MCRRFLNQFGNSYPRGVNIDCHQGTGPWPVSGTRNGDPLDFDAASFTVVCPTIAGEAGKLILSNKGATNGRDTDRMSIKVQCTQMYPGSSVWII